MAGAETKQGLYRKTTNSLAIPKGELMIKLDKWMYL
jgi:hypothetical protein